MRHITELSLPLLDAFNKWLVERSVQQDTFRVCRIYIGPINEVYSLNLLKSKPHSDEVDSIFNIITELVQVTCPGPNLRLVEAVLVYEKPEYNEEVFQARNLYEAVTRCVHVCLAGAGMLTSRQRTLPFTVGDVFEVDHRDDDYDMSALLYSSCIHLVTTWSPTGAPLADLVTSEEARVDTSKRTYINLPWIPAV